MMIIQNGSKPMIIATSTQSERKCITQEGVLYCEKIEIPNIPPIPGLVLSGLLLVFMIIGAIKFGSDFSGTVGDYVIGAMTGALIWFMCVFLLAVFGFLLNGVLS